MNSKGKTIEWLEQVPWIPLQCLGRASLQGMVKSDGNIQSELAVFLPSAQTFINITSQPTGKPTSNLKRKKEDHIRPDWHDVRLTISCASYFREHYRRNRNVSCQQKKNNILFTWGTLTPARRWTGLRVMWSCVHLNVHLHLVVQDLHKLLHGWQMTRFQFGPHRYI